MCVKRWVSSPSYYPSHWVWSEAGTYMFYQSSWHFYLSYKRECFLGWTSICNLFGLTMQVIISPYLGCVYKRKEPDGKEWAGVPGGFMTELPNMVGLSPSDLVFKWIWNSYGSKGKENKWVKGQLHIALRRCSQLMSLDGLEKTSSLPLNHVESPGNSASARTLSTEIPVL